MPELPEVENVRLSLESQGFCGQRFKNVELRRKNLRTPLRADLKKKLPGQDILRIFRRAKFLLFETQDFVLLNHLGMTGSWKVLNSDSVVYGKHDHVALHFESGLTLVYNDPRRFGLLELLKKSEVDQSRWLKSLGTEPLNEAFSCEMLFEATRKKKASIKGFLMDQKNVVGVGNIYASEALFRAKVTPLKPAGRVKKEEARRIVSCVQEILKQAISAGGSTISDYRNSKGESGQFQDRFLVYDRRGSPCVSCGASIRSKVIAGRNTFWCSRCQR